MMSDSDNQPLDADALRAAQFSDISSGLNGALNSLEATQRKRHRLSIAFLFFVALNVADQLSKQWARTTLQPFTELTYFGGLVRLHHSENPGAFLSLGAQLGAQMRLGIFTLLVCVFLVWATWMLVKKSAGANWAFVLGWALLISGGVGNVIDRVWKSTVTDFMVMGWGNLQTGVFNIADMAIMLGIIVVLVWGRDNVPQETIGFKR
jgi:signal peptidase II